MNLSESASVVTKVSMTTDLSQIHGRNKCTKVLFLRAYLISRNTIVSILLDTFINIRAIKDSS